MRDIFDDLFRGEPIDPVEAARRAGRPQLPRRFYRSAGVGEAEGEFRLLLDGRPVKTPARHPLAVPTRALAQAIADEWEAQGEHIDPARMPLTRLANSILDGVRTAAAPVAAEIGKYLASDLLVYRADVPGLAARQAALWDPVLDWAREELGASFALSEGVVFVEQPAAALARARRAVPDDPWRLGWGRDALALERRVFRFAEMQAAATLLAALGRELAPVSLSLPPRSGGEGGEDQRSEPGGGT